MTNQREKDGNKKQKRIHFNRLLIIALLILALMGSAAGCGQRQMEEDALTSSDENSAGAQKQMSDEASGESKAGTAEPAGKASQDANDNAAGGTSQTTNGSAAGGTSQDSDNQAAGDMSQDPAHAEKTVLPSYSYPGRDPLYQTICAYILSEIAEGEAESGQIIIPCPVIIDIDETNPEDILVSGEFWYHTYELEGDVLQTVAAENAAGIIHLRKADAAYEVTQIDCVEDETDNAEELFGENYQAYLALNTFVSVREIFRIRMLEDYLLVNDIPAVECQNGEYDTIDLIPKTADLSSENALTLHDTDGAGQTYTFTYGGETFTAQYTEDNWKIIDSWKIRNAGDMELICDALNAIHTVHGRDGDDTRTAADMAFEWAQHNFAYEHLPEDHPWRENAKDVDLNPADQWKTFFEIYEDRAGERFRIGDFLGDLSVYLQMLQEVELD